ncbi:MAG: hypothetical protein LAO78_20200 [Acidobacteriia bacterium]|nr:hypothetical protein [Terriglobia bacterium]
MKIWWPWRRKRTLTLFEERVPWLGEAPDAKPIRLAPQGPAYLQRHPLNAAGPFYVGHGECMACGYPHVLAPDLMGWELDRQGRYSHCYFRKQPVTSQEIEQAVHAIHGSCCGALHYAGSDREILKRLS